MPTSDQFATPGLVIPAGTLITPSGPPGPQGTSFVFKGTITDPSQLPAPPGNNVGDTYIDTVTGDAYVWDGVQWDNVGGALQGPPGTSFTFKGAVSNASYLPTTGNTVGDIYLDQSTGEFWAWDGAAWVNIGGYIAQPTFIFGGSVTDSSGLPASGSQVGEIYFDESDGTQWVWNGSTWVNVGTSIQGPPGPAGPPGAGISLKGQVPTEADLPTTGNTVGDTWVAVDTGDGWTWDGTTWVNIGPIQGPPGPAGTPSYDYTATQFIVPAVGSTAQVTIQTGGWVTVGQYVWLAGAGPAGVAAAFQVMAVSGAILTLLNPTAQQLTAADLISGNLGNIIGLGTDSLLFAGEAQFIADEVISTDTGNLLTEGSDGLLSVPISTIEPVIWSVRLRSYNAIGNPNFECGQRISIGTLAAGATFTWPCDRWLVQKTGSMVLGALNNSGTAVALPGTSFNITRGTLFLNIQTPAATLGAGDFVQVSQFVEGSTFRELATDVHSISLLVNSSIAPLRFAVSLRNAAATASLVKLCTITTPDVFVLVPLPNLPVFPVGSFDGTPGVLGEQLTVCFACGATYMAPAADNWQNGNFFGAPGMDNWAANPAGTAVSLAFIQHEPGSLCTTLIDKPFDQNLDECLRYYCRSYGYGINIGTLAADSYDNLNNLYGAGTPYLNGRLSFHRPMAKAPTVTMYNQATGAINTLRQAYTSTDFAVVSATGGQNGVVGVTLSTNAPAYSYFACHWLADTAW